MKFALASDVHLEFGAIELKNTENAKVLVLSGDICVAKDLREPDMYGIVNVKHSITAHNFFKQVCSEFEYVVYVMGNHEHYHGDYKYTLERLRQHLGYLENLYILENQTLTVDDVTFIGGTLWTDMNKEDPNTLYGVKGYMNDFQIVDDSREPVHFRDQDGNFHTRVGKLSPQAVVEAHKGTLKFIDETTSAWPWAKFVVCGHHAPSKLSTKPRYQKDVMVNGAYSSDLSEFMLDRPQIKVWTHGHTHDPFDYMVGSCRVVCNPRGYINYEDIADKFELKFIEV